MGGGGESGAPSPPPVRRRDIPSVAGPQRLRGRHRSSQRLYTGFSYPLKGTASKDLLHLFGSNTFLGPQWLGNLHRHAGQLLLLDNSFSHSQRHTVQLNSSSHLKDMLDNSSSPSKRLIKLSPPTQKHMLPTFSWRPHLICLRKRKRSQTWVLACS